MAEPITPSQAAAPVKSALVVADVDIEYPDGYAPGDRYEVRFILNRALDAHERRILAADSDLRDLEPGYDYLWTQDEVDTIDPRFVEEFLHKLNDRAARWRQEAREDRERHLPHRRRLRQHLRPN